MLRSVNVTIVDIEKCKKEYQEFAEDYDYQEGIIPFGINYVDGMNICAGKAGKGTCNVRFIMQK